MLFQSVPANTAGRDLVVGDIHGYFSRLQCALDAVGFDPARDRLFSVGDLVDRGPESDQVLDWLDRPWFFAVRGNHDQMAIDWVGGMMDRGMYIANGGAWNIANPKELQVRIADAFSALPIAIEVESAAGPVGIVHADCPYSDWHRFGAVLDGRLDSSSELDHIITMAQWSRSRAELRIHERVENIRAVVVGHNPAANVRVFGNVYHIDTFGWLPRSYEGRFTLLDLKTLEVV